MLSQRRNVHQMKTLPFPNEFRTSFIGKVFSFVGQAGMLLFFATASATENEEMENCTAPLPPQTLDCGLYIAESTLPGAGLGVFTAYNRPKDSVVSYGDICVPFKDLYWHNTRPLTNPFKDYFWSGPAMGMLTETDTDDIEALCFGLGCTVNCHLPLVNVAKAFPQYDDRLHRSKDPGAGAFSPYFNGSNVATRDIPAGGEIFKYYGDHWFESRHRLFGNIPLTRNYAEAHRLLKRLMLLPESSRQDTYQLVLQFNLWDSRTLNALPNNLKDARRAADSPDMGILYQDAATRSLEWLNEHGRCIDHIRPGPSTLPQAGRGAFATRDIPANTRITTSPLHHLANKSFLDLYKLTLDQLQKGKKIWMRHIDQVEGTQLMINYCFGHAESTVLLCPYGAGVQYINDNKTQVNVRVTWADNFVAHDQHFLQTATVQDLAETERSKLAFDYIATREIKAGEELFLDYSDAWLASWEQHEKSFTKSEKDSSYLSAHSWNELYGDALLRTTEEAKLDPYPDNLQLRCHSMLIRTEGSRQRKFEWRDRDFGEACRILSRVDANETAKYTVQMEIWPLEYDDEEVTWMERRNVDRSAIRFFDMPGTTDWHLPGAFRHPIFLSDDLFPLQWKNIG